MSFEWGGQQRTKYEVAKRLKVRREREKNKRARKQRRAQRLAK